MFCKKKKRKQKQVTLSSVFTPQGIVSYIHFKPKLEEMG